MQAAPPRRYTFDTFVVDARARELVRAGIRQRVPDQSIQVLLALLEHAGDIVTREELQARLWPLGTFVDFEQGLNSVVRRLRHALGDTASVPRYIETLPRRGYRFIGPVKVWSDHAPGIRAADGPDAGRRLGRWVAFSAVVIALAALVLASSMERPPTVEAGLSFEDVATRLTFDDGLQTQPSLSPDGHRLAYAADTHGDFDIWTQPVAGGEAVRLTRDPADDWQPDWSPDGTRIVYRSERDGGGLFVSALDGTPDERLTTGGASPLWAPDGRHVLYLDTLVSSLRSMLHVVDIRRGAARPVAHAEGAAGWHADGRHVVVLSSLPGPFAPSAMSVDIIAGQIRHWRVRPAVTRAFIEAELSIPVGGSVHWGPRQTSLVFVGDVHGARSVWSVGVDEQARELVPPLRRIATGPEASHVAVARAGTRMAVSASSHAARLWISDLDADGTVRAGSSRPLTPTPMHVERPDVSRRGDVVVFVRSRPGGELRREVVVRHLADDYEQVVRVQHQNEVLLYPRVNGTGTRVSFTVIRRDTATDASQRVVVADLATRRETPLTSWTRVSDIEHATQWAPDDIHIVASGRRYVPGRPSIVLLPLDTAPNAERHGRVVTTVDVGELTQASVSPDGRWVVFRVADTEGSQAGQIAVVGVTGGTRADWTVLTSKTSHADKPRWSDRGDAIYFIEHEGADMDLWRLPFDSAHGRPAGIARRIAVFGGPGRHLLRDIRALEVGIGGGRLVLPIVQPRGGIWMLDNWGSPRPAH
jgi:Tol biopolymer transport system component/DNA-binding winged helix-turn-helix (wHTH) protein